jgi:hypothetical protein
MCIVVPESRIKQSFSGYSSCPASNDAAIRDMLIDNILQPCSYSKDTSRVWDILIAGVLVQARFADLT